MPDPEPYTDCRTCPYAFSKLKCLHERCPFHRSELAEFRCRTEGKVHAMAVEIWHPRTKPPYNVDSEVPVVQSVEHCTCNAGAESSSLSGHILARFDNTFSLQDTGIVIFHNSPPQNYGSNPCDHHNAAKAGLTNFTEPINFPIQPTPYNDLSRGLSHPLLRPALTPYNSHGAQALHESVATQPRGSLLRQGVLPHL